MSNTRGIFITFEGADGVGKSTQVEFYSSLLKDLGYDVLLLREPGTTRIGEKIREILLDVNNNDLTPQSELLLYLASRSQIVNEQIMPALCCGKIVLCDRFSDSTLAYQGFGRQLDKDFIISANKFVCDSCVPDLTIVFDIPKEERKKRVKKRDGADRIESEGAKFLDDVASGFLSIANDDPTRVKVVDTSSKHSVTAKNVIKVTSKLIPVDINSDFVLKKLDELDLSHDHSNESGA